MENFLESSGTKNMTGSARMVAAEVTPIRPSLPTM